MVATPRTNIPNPEQFDFYHIKVTVGGQVVTGNLSADLVIPDDPELLAKDIAKQPSLFYYWSSVAEVAKIEYNKLKNEFDLWYAERYLISKRELVEELGKSYVTDTMVRARLVEKYGDEYKEYQELLLRAEYRKNVLTLASKAFLEKGSSMINLLSWRKAHLNDVAR